MYLTINCESDEHYNRLGSELNKEHHVIINMGQCKPKYGVNSK